MPLDGFPSLCEERAKTILSQDRRNPQKHIGQNKDYCAVSHYQIDGVVLKEGKRCDFLLMNDEKRTAYLIELKGSDLCRAAQQLEATAAALSQPLSGYTLYYRIIANKCKTQEIESTAFLKYRMKWKRLKYGSKTIEEEI